MNNKSNEKLSDELLDTSLNEDNRLEAVQKFVKDNLFYIIAGTSLVIGVAHYMYDYYQEFDPQPYLDNNGTPPRTAPTLELIVGFSVLGVIFVQSLQDKGIDKIKLVFLMVYLMVLSRSCRYDRNNQDLFNQGFRDGGLGNRINQEVIDDFYYREGVQARQRGLERIDN